MWACCCKPGLTLQTVFLFIYHKWRHLTAKPSAVITPPFATVPLLHLSVCPCSEGPCPALRHIAVDVGLLKLPHFMLPWFLCAHMLGDYGRPFKQAVDEIIRALWAMHWHHKHCALSCPLRRVMLVIFLKSVKVRPASLTQVNCSGSYWMLPWIHLPSKRWWRAAILTNAKCFFFCFFIMYITSLTAVWVLFESLYRTEL